MAAAALGSAITTKTFKVAIQEVDKHSRVDPELIVSSNNLGLPNSVFKDSHPSVYMPTHQYRKYKMKGGRNGTGLGVIKEKPLSNSQFAIMNLLRNTSSGSSASQIESSEPYQATRSAS